MNLYALLKEVGINTELENAEITDVTDCIEEVKKGSVFVCIKGSRDDGHRFAEEAVNKGAAAVISEQPLEISKMINVRSTRLIYSFLCSAFYGHPEDSLKIIGITGTNGKTTTAEYIRHIITASGKKCGVIGTLGCGFGDNIIDTSFTTPGGNELYRLLKQMADSQCEYCVMEVSSQALSQERAAAITFKLGIVTNIGYDHLDYHKTHKNYVEAKLKLITQCEKLLINSDDAFAKQFINAAGNKLCSTFSALSGNAKYTAHNIRTEAYPGSYMFFDGSNMLRVPVIMPGMAGVYNSLAAGAACLMLGFDFKAVSSGLSSLPYVTGRAQRFVSKKGFAVYIDYAHTPEALSSMLTALQGFCSGKIITVFGCGGERYKEKRRLMGSIASELSDVVIVTEDNSRSESPQIIINEICSGIRKKNNLYCEPNRADAIRLAISKAEKKDIILIAGKGHEEYIIRNNIKFPFSDIQTVKNELEAE